MKERTPPPITDRTSSTTTTNVANNSKSDTTTYSRTPTHNNTNDNNKRSLIGSYRSPYSSITNLQHHLRRAQLHLDNNDNEHHNLRLKQDMFQMKSISSLHIAELRSDIDEQRDLVKKLQLKMKEV